MIATSVYMVYLETHDERKGTIYTWFFWPLDIFLGLYLLFSGGTQDISRDGSVFWIAYSWINAYKV